MPQRPRLLALELRASRIGFVVLEKPEQLLDWGVRSFTEQGVQLESALSDRIATLLAFYNPSAIVLRTHEYPSAARNKRFQTLLAAIKTQAHQNSVNFCAFSASQVRNHFATNGQITKYQIAAHLAHQFDELSWKLPGRRKVYQSERAVMLVFDALATGVAFSRQPAHTFKNSARPVDWPFRWPLTDE